MTTRHTTIDLTPDQDHALYSAFLGIMVLGTMLKKAGIMGGYERSKELLVEMDQAFPGLSASSALRR